MAQQDLWLATYDILSQDSVRPSSHVTMLLLWLLLLYNDSSKSNSTSSSSSDDK